MNLVPRASQWGELIRPDRVHGSLYSDPAIFEAELARSALERKRA